MRRTWTILLSLALLAAPAWPQDDADAPLIPGNPHEHEPGARRHAEAMRHYESGNYRVAMGFFRYSAYWADKLSQHNLGVMHYLGQGTPRDPARAWAWFELAAERKYPQLIEVADRVWGELDEDERERARTILDEELKPEYGDQVAVQRTARRMERERRKTTGSRTGFIPLGLEIITDDSGMTRSAEDYYAAEKWDFYQLIELEAKVFDALHRGRVRVSPLEIIDDEGENGGG